MNVQSPIRVSREDRQAGNVACLITTAQIQHLVEAGFALHWLRERSKAPFVDAWSTEPVYSLADLKGSYRAGYNVGVRLGEPSRVSGLYLYLLDMDVRSPRAADQAKARLREILPEYDRLPTVISGSGGESRHFYFLSPGRFRSKKLAHSGVKFTGVDGREHWTWEIELFGTGKQAVIPPSIHPETGKPYRWLREFDFEAIELGIAPEVSAERVAGWFPNADVGVNDAADDDEDLQAYLHKQPMDLTQAEIDRTLADLPLPDWCEDRDGWLNVGMALHHQFQGSDEGLKLWNEFSRQSEKFNPRDSERVWKSFRTSSKSLRFAVLLRAAADARLRADLSGGIEDDLLDGDDDLLGEVAEGAKPSLTVVETDWTRLLDRTEEGAVKNTLPNVELIIRHDPRFEGVVAFNEFSLMVVQKGVPGHKHTRRASPKGTRQLRGPIWRLNDSINGDTWTDTHDHMVRSILEAAPRQGGYGIKVTDRDLHGALDIVAHDNSFHPVRDYLTSVRWDSVKRLDRVFITYLGTEDSAYTRSVSRLTFLGAVARIMEPGHKFDFATILEGVQGKRKTSFIEAMAKHWFSELHPDFNNQNKLIESMAGAWVMEIPELSGFRRAEVTAIKAFISAKKEKARLAWAKRVGEFKRQCIFIGSTNDREYLRDDTGGRRFWPIECRVEKIDIDEFRREVDQIWAEAKSVYDEMRAAQPYGDLPLYLTDEVAQQAALHLQETRRIETAEDAMAGQIAAWLDAGVGDDGFEDGEANPLRTKTCLVEIWVECFGRDRSNYGQLQAQQIGRAMKKIDGWFTDGSFHRFAKYGHQRMYQRIA